MTETDGIRVVLADDHNLVREGLRALLEKADGIVVVGEAENGQEAIDQVRSLLPEVLLLDWAMPGLGGAAVIQEVKRLGCATQIVILSMYADQSLVRKALQLGANGYLLKGSSREELMLAIRSAHRGDLFLSPGITRSAVEPFLNPPQESVPRDPWELLTPREREILDHVVHGRTNQAIADTLQVSVKTVEKHRYNLMAKLGVHNLAELVTVSAKHNVVVP